MNEDLNIFEFNKLMNEAKPVIQIITKLSFFDVKILSNMLLIHEIQYYCKPSVEKGSYRYDLDTVLGIVQNKLHKNANMEIRKKIEEMCDDHYYYIFSLS